MILICYIFVGRLVCVFVSCDVYLSVYNLWIKSEMILLFFRFARCFGVGCLFFFLFRLARFIIILLFCLIQMPIKFALFSRENSSGIFFSFCLFVHLLCFSVLYNKSNEWVRRIYDLDVLRIPCKIVVIDPKATTIFFFRKWWSNCG